MVMFTNNKNTRKITSTVSGPTVIYLRLVVNKADLIHFPARRKEQLIETRMEEGWKVVGVTLQYWWQRAAESTDYQTAVECNQVILTCRGQAEAAHIQLLLGGYQWTRLYIVQWYPVPHNVSR